MPSLNYDQLSELKTYNIAIKSAECNFELISYNIRCSKINVAVIHAYI